VETYVNAATICSGFVICSQRFTESGFVMEDMQRALHFTFHCRIMSFHAQ